MSLSRENVFCLTSAMAVGHSCSADILRRTVSRNPSTSAEQRELLECVEALATLRAGLAEALDDYERSGAVVVATLCRAVIADPLSTFSPVERWGVCAVSGCTVSRQLLVRANGSETLVDARFGHFLRSVWCVSHWELVEASRFEGDANMPEAGTEELCALYLQACEEITATMELTGAALAKRRCAQE